MCSRLGRNWTWDCFIVSAWQSTNTERLLVVSELCPQPQIAFGFRSATCADQGAAPGGFCLSQVHYDWSGNSFEARGLYVDMAPWYVQVFSITKRSKLAE